MKKAIAMLAMVFVAGCGDLQWFPDTNASSKSSNSSNSSSTSNSSNSSGTFNNSTTGTSTVAATFATKCSVAAGSTVTSNEITVSGSSSTPQKLTITGGKYAINSDTYMSVSNTVYGGQKVKVQHTAAASGATTTVVTTTLTIGGVPYDFKSDTTANACTK